jgi:hypothetical protein
LRSEARAKGLDKLTKQDIDKAVAESRREVVAAGKPANRARR